jgi:PAS domain S-box-containing protein
MEKRSPKAAIHESERRFRVLVENTPDVVMTLDRKGEIQYINHTLPEYTVDDVIGTCVTDYLPPEDGQRYIQAITEVFEVGESRVLLIEAAGPTSWLSRLSPVKLDGSVESVMVIATDITELKQRASQQAAIAELGQRALAGMPLPEFMDLVVNVVADVLSIEFCKILKLLPGGDDLLLLAGVGWKEGLVGHARVHVEDNSQAGYTLQRREPVIVEDKSTERRFTLPPLLEDHGVVSGMSVVIYGPSQPYGVFGAHTAKRRIFTKNDASFLQSAANLLGTVIENAAVADRLRVSEDRLRKLFEQSNDAVFIHNIRGKILDVNPRACELTGYDENELRGLMLGALHPAEDTAASINALELTKQEGSARFESKMIRKDQTVIDVEISARIIGEERDVIQGIVRDISRRKKFEQEITKLSNENRWLARQTMAAQEQERKRIALELHDELGQVVSAIKMDANIVQRDARKPRVREVAREISMLSDQVVDMVTSMMERLHPLALRHAGLIDTLREMINAVQRRHKDIEVGFHTSGEFELADEECSINIYRVVQESLTNVVRHSQANRVQISLNKHPDSIELTIQDNGRGMDMDKIRPGHGLLGMRERIQLLGGEMSIDSAPGNGVKISAIIPTTKEMD